MSRREAGEPGASEDERAAPREITRSPVTAFAIGALGGALSVLFGVGAGLFMVPALVSMLRLRPQRAVGTALAVALPTAALGVANYRVALDWAIVAELALGSVLGGILGAVLAGRERARESRAVFGVLVALVGMALVFVAARPAANAAVTLHGAAIFGIGVAIGAVSSLIGLGGGVAMVPFLALALYYPQKLAHAVSLAVVVPVSLSGAVLHGRKGNVIWTLAVPLLIGALLGAQATGGWIHRISDPWLRGLFGAFLVAVGVSLVAARRARKGAALQDG